MRFATYVILSIVLTVTATAQVSTGIPPFSSLGGGPFDQINLGNFNVHFAIPVLHKAGRGLPFNYDLVYDSSFWSPVTSNGATQWQPGAGWGWTSNIASLMGHLQVTNVLTQQTLKYCNGAQQKETATYVYYDSKGRSHPFPGSTYYTYTWGGFCRPQGYSYGPNLNTDATDGSGYELAAQANPNLLSTVSTYAGQIVGFANGLIGSPFQDSNGNYISYNSSSQEFFDTLSSSTPVLTIAGSGTPSSPTTYTYTAPSGGSAKYTVNYTQYTVATKFAVAGVTEYGPVSVALVSSIGLPDGTQYTFSYEATPGSCTPLANTYSNNCVTGRMEEVTLPTGGSITYSYNGGPGSTGIYSDGSTAGLTRVLNPGGTWQYARSLLSGTAGPGSTWQSTTTDPQSNQSVIDFSEDSTTNGTSTVATYNMYETQRQVYQGSQSSGNLLETMIHCYNGNYASCPGAAVHSPISQTDAYSKLPNGATRLSEIAYNGSFTGSGLVSSDSEYDFGVSMGAAPGTTHLIRQVQTSYASLGNGLISYPSSVVTYDYSSGSAVLLSSTSYSYDQSSPTTTTGTPQHNSITGSRGNLTTATYQTNSGGSTLSQKYSYYDTGNIGTATDVNNAVFTYSYGACGNSFPTSISEPLSLSRSMTWICAGGVENSVADENGQTVTTNYTNSDFWRPDNFYDQQNNETSITYSGQAASETTLSFNSGQSVVDVRSTLDGFGRPILSQRQQGPGAGNYDTTETDYNVSGQPYRITMPFSAAQGVTNPSAPDVEATYDALGRPLTVTNKDNGETSYTYTNNDVLVTVSGGSQSFSKQLEYDGVGRLTSVCEISSTLTGRGTCAQSASKTGFWTKYSYNAAGQLLTVTQDAQTSPQSRSYYYDMVGRMTSETDPETGTATYTYDTACTTTPASPGNLTGKVDGAGNHTCFYYDAFHRLNGGGWNQVCRVFNYDTNGTPPNGVTVANTKTRLREAATTNCGSTVYTDEWFSYSARGELTDVYESTQHSGGYYHTSTSYWPSGAVQTLSGNDSIPTINYGGTGSGLDPEGRYTQVAASPTSPVTSVTYDSSGASNPLGALIGVTYGSSDSDSFGYDPNTGQMKSYSFAVNSATDAGTLAWNANGTLGGFNITDGISGTSDTQSCSFSYDDLARSSGINCGTQGSQSFSYDAFGNLSTTANALGVSFQPTSYNSANQPVISGMSFDADGNTKTDNLANQYAWDPNWGTMSSVNTVTAFSDAFGRAVELDNGSSYAEIVYSPLGKTALMNGSSLITAFVPLPGGGTAVYNSSGIAYYRHADWLGSSRLASTPSRTLYSSNAYAPFGEAYLSSGNSDASFTGQDQDTISSLYDFTFRRLSPSQGRWISPDPSGLAAVDPTTPQTWNRYAYVGNNPLSFVDPMGLNVGHTGFCAAANSCPGGTWNDPSFSFAPNSPTTVPYGFAHPDYWAEWGIFGSAWDLLVNFGGSQTWDIASNGFGGAPSNDSTIPSYCKAAVLGAVNSQFGTNFTNANIQSSFMNGGGANLVITASGLPAAQFNGLQTGRYASGFLNAITGVGPSLHIAGYSAVNDPNAIFNNSNIGGMTSVTFTAHTDSAFANNPFGALLHYILDVSKHGKATRNPCP